MLLATVGVYGVAAQAAAQRQAELALRMALGATSRDVLRLVVGGTLRLTAAGIAVGACAAWLSAGLLRDLLYEVDVHDTSWFALACCLLAMAGC